MESDVITLSELFKFKIDGIQGDRTVVGGLRATGLRPTFVDKFERHGVELPSQVFGKPRDADRLDPRERAGAVRLARAESR